MSKFKMSSVEKEFLEKYGRLDWDCSDEQTSDEEKAKEGKRYEGHVVLMNLKGGLMQILTCKVLKVTKEGFLVEPYSMSGVASEEEDEAIDYDEPIPFRKFFHVFLQK